MHNVSDILLAPESSRNAGPSARSPVALPILAAVFLALGGLSAVGTVGWWVEQGYTVLVDAPDALEWNFWLPLHDVPMPSSTEGTVITHGAVETVHGRLLNLSGVGEARVRFSRSSVVFSLETPGPDSAVLLSGREGQAWPASFWVRRQSSDPSVNVTMAAGTGWKASRLGDEWSCGGPGFHGQIAEGWSTIPERFYDCLGSGFGIPLAVFPAATFLTPGVVFLRRAWRERSRSPPT